MKTLFLYLIILILSYPNLTFASKKTPVQSTIQKQYESENIDVPEKTSPPFFSNFQVIFGINAGGPVLFKDTADTTLNKTTLFMFGGNLEFVFGHYKASNHRIGLGISYDLIAQSENRNLSFLKTFLVYQTGFPFNAEFHLGGNIATGDPDFAQNYTGLYTGVVLKYNFVTEDHNSYSASLGLKGQFILTPNDMAYNSAFLGVVFEYVFRTDKF